MSETSTRMRVMLQSYEHQLLAARRLVRLRENIRIAQGKDREDPDPSIARRAYVEKIANEIFNMLLYTGSTSPIVEEIRTELSRVMGFPLQFIYPPGKRLRIIKTGENGPEALDAEEQLRARTTLIRITREKINQTLIREAT